ncbi:MAG: glycosyltransferase family 2 protein, partial [Chitinophagaceae bacterium]
MIIYIFFIVVFIIFCAGQLRSLIMLMISVTRKRAGITSEITDPYPGVLIQIPVYKEGWEVKDAAIAAMMQDYPKEKLAVQIIDDSPEHYHDLVRYLQTEAERIGVQFEYLNRTSRHGYKSGALNYGMQFSDHELITVLDADFILVPDFLKKSVGYFKDENMAGVQTSWLYRNHFENAITATQATIFETIFALEQRGRSNLGSPALFTGTSGIWRRSVILEIGGWRETPFTAEDIDLSFRSYHRGYQFSYIDQHLSTCEATSSFIAFKHQQQRWSRG